MQPICPCAVTSCVAGSSHSFSIQQVLSLCITGPRLPDPRLLCQAPYLLDSGFPQWCALLIAHICFKKVIVFSGTWHGRNRDEAIRNSINSQQSSSITMVIFLNSMFTSVTGFQSKKTPFSTFAKPAGRHPHLICMPDYPAQQLSCVLVHPDRRDVHASPCLGLGHSGW